MTVFRKLKIGILIIECCYLSFLLISPTIFFLRNKAIYHDAPQFLLNIFAFTFVGLLILLIVFSKTLYSYSRISHEEFTKIVKMSTMLSPLNVFICISAIILVAYQLVKEIHEPLEII